VREFRFLYCTVAVHVNERLLDAGRGTELSVILSGVHIGITESVRGELSEAFDGAFAGVNGHVAHLSAICALLA